MQHKEGVWRTAAMQEIEARYVDAIGQGSLHTNIFCTLLFVQPTAASTLHLLRTQIRS